MSSSTETVETVSYQWTDYQAHVRDLLEDGDCDVVVLRIGYGGGKSRCGAQWIHRGGMTDTEGVGESLVMAQDYEKGKSTTYSVYFKTLPGEDTNPFKDGDPENSPIVDDYNANDKRVVYVTGHTVWLGGADKWSRFAGGEFARIWCDEVAHYPPQTDLYDLHRMLTTRQRTDVGPNTTLWTSTGNGFNQYFDITERQVQPDGDGGEMPLPWRDRLEVVVASTEHNTLLPEDGLEKIKRQFKGTAREEQGLHGGFAAAEGLVYDSFSRNTHVRPREDIEIRDDIRLYGYDYGWGDPRVLIEYGKTHADQYVAWDAYYETGKSVEHAISWLQDNDKPVGPIYCDHDPEHIQKFRDAGYPAEAATKDLDEGIQEVQAVLEVDEVGPGLIVVDDLTELIQEFQSYKEDDVGTARADDHCLDVTRYAVMGDRYVEEDEDNSGTGVW
ncbi:terminase large subunit domain-containing protein [Haloterrigena salifodinae]|uniref:terminase large subunit domain-containing protein n=1 Tax=Haloterrigena salifodinae TaxID=2675099 RepID=UPI000F866945|nr:terminase family protein [Haloterrigena salifodinae]